MKELVLDVVLFALAFTISGGACMKVTCGAGKAAAQIEERR